VRRKKKGTRKNGTSLLSPTRPLTLRKNTWRGSLWTLGGSPLRNMQITMGVQIITAVRVKGTTSMFVLRRAYL
jgi:hypothetical protein